MRYKSSGSAGGGRLGRMDRYGRLEIVEVRVVADVEEKE